MQLPDGLVDAHARSDRWVASGGRVRIHGSSIGMQEQLDVWMLLGYIADLYFFA